METDSQFTVNKMRKGNLLLLDEVACADTVLEK